MKSLIKSILGSLLILWSINISAQDKKALNIDDSKIALQGYSPVSYLDLGLAQKGSKDFKAVHLGVSYYFTSNQQVTKFKANPSRYLPQFGGFCAFGIYAGAKFRTDPHKFVVSNDKLYLFLYDLEVDAKELWVAESESKLLPVARANWSKLKSAH